MCAHDGETIRRRSATPVTTLLRITPIERATLQWLAEGKDAPHMASALGITEDEASARVATLITKMGAKSLLDAVAQAFTRGLLRSEEHHSFLGGTSNVKPRSISL
jgi:DNA-binding NarL/FixJ family response regulator